MSKDHLTPDVPTHVHFVSEALAHELTGRHGTPLFVYSTQSLQERAAVVTGLDVPFGLVVRYAAKANPHPEVIKTFLDLGLHFDASSSFEAVMLLEQGVPGNKISLSSQQSASNLKELLDAGVKYVATSMHQLELFALAADQDAHVALRVNPSIDGAGHNNRMSTGGVASSFGLWHEHIAQALTFAESKGVTIDRLHIHIGSGADPAIWAKP